MKTVVEALREGRELISDPANWKQGGLAEIVGQNEGITGPYCAIGALAKATETFSIGPTLGGNRRTGSGHAALYILVESNVDNIDMQEVRKQAVALLEDCLGRPVHEYNDSNPHECVMAAFDAAIEKAEAEHGE